MDYFALRSLPHRQLRKQKWQEKKMTDGSLPHRQLRKRWGE